MNLKFYLVPLAVMVAGITWLGGPSHSIKMQGDQDDWCSREHRGRYDRGWYCEVRELEVAPGGGPLSVDGGTNGGISVEGWDRDRIHVRARVWAHARHDDDARSLVSEVRVDAAATRIRADGPKNGRHESWGVSYDIKVPRRMDLDLETTNGGISVAEVSGSIEFRATNGGVSLDGLSGDVHGSTTNGGLKVQLTGFEWNGAGLDVHTTNGGVKVFIPEDYNADFETGTTNGSLSVGFPIVVQGRIDRQFRTRLGRGGAPVRVMTTNGGVVIDRN